MPEMPSDASDELDPFEYVVISRKNHHEVHLGPMTLVNAVVIAKGLEGSGCEKVMVRDLRTGTVMDLEYFILEHPGIGGGT